MFLKALSLKGFKSFADTTTLEFEPGITVVVGPNGSGKSNVVDAVGWVLGAQAPSAVRSQRMDDVIFAGTTQRPALGRAEVSLTLDNSSGLLPIEFSEVTLTRILWRSGDSEYAINGVPCRLLDIQELLSDTGVGRQQHVIVGQGQIDGVLNARPEDRRMIIEEAAGILKHRKRKERSERRLAATEGNLLRLRDLQREVRRQLKPLERQAEAARRHGTLMEELRALQIYTAGRELSTLRRRMSEASAARAESVSEERALQQRLADIDTAILAAEAELKTVAGDGAGSLGNALARLEALRERARGLHAVLTQRQRAIDHDRAAAVDRELTASLEADASRLVGELADLEQLSEGELAPALAALESDEAKLRDERGQLDRAFGAHAGDAQPPEWRELAEARAELASLRTSVERAMAEQARVQQRVERLNQRIAHLTGEVDQLETKLDDARRTESELATALTAAEEARTTAELYAGAADRQQRASEAERHALEGRLQALQSARQDAQARAGVDHLDEVDDVVGTLVDLVEVDEGWEAAVEAALGEALSAVVVSSVAAARQAVDILARGDVAGAVVALGAPRSAAARHHPIGEPVRAHVRAQRPDVDQLLDVLIGTAVAVDGDLDSAIDAAVELAEIYPDAVVVTRAGGRFGPTGWRAVPARSHVSEATVEAVRKQAVAAAEAAAAAEVERDEAADAAQAAREAADVARRTLDEHQRTMAVLAERGERVRRERDAAVAEAESLVPQRAEVDERVAAEQTRIQELEALVPRLEVERAAAEERAQALSAARRQLDDRAAVLASRRNELEVRRAAVADRHEFLTERLAEVRDRLARSGEAREAAAGRHAELERSATVVNRLAQLVADRTALIDSHLAEVAERRRQQSEDERRIVDGLDNMRRERLQSEHTLEQLRERGRRAEIEEAEVRLRLEQATEHCRVQLDVEPHVAINASAPELPDGVPPAARVHELERELKLMGPVNPLALEEFDALQERHDFLQAQLDDVRSSRRELNKVIRAVDDEIVRVFAAAYADVSQNLTDLFATLFPGGQGGLRLTDPDDLLNSGVEIEARPSGKNVKKISLLSGGERSLTALAFLFAVFRSRPSPFYILDEVEAALDDVNLHRFLNLVAEFRREAQLVIVTHQKRTMEAAEILYGVTMQPGGSSKVISENVTV
jgi:chromosome segregation protein